MNFEHIIWVQVLLGLYLEELKKKKYCQKWSICLSWKLCMLHSPAMGVTFSGFEFVLSLCVWYPSDIDTCYRNNCRNICKQNHNLFQMPDFFNESFKCGWAPLLANCDVSLTSALPFTFRVLWSKKMSIYYLLISYCSDKKKP